MIKTYVPYEPDQQLLLPAALQEWLPDDHVAYFISDVVDQLDMSKVTARYERERRGGPPYHPRMMVKVLLFGYCVGVASSRRIAQRLHEDIAFRVLAANNTPDFRTISDFRKDNVDALSPDKSSGSQGNEDGDEGQRNGYQGPHDGSEHQYQNDEGNGYAELLALLNSLGPPSGSPCR